jgi:hypothetical protein
MQRVRVPALPATEGAMNVEKHIMETIEAGGAMDVEKYIIETVQDMLAINYGLQTLQSSTPHEFCKVCGVKNKPKEDYLGNPNGFFGHTVGTCIENLRERIELLEKANESAR